MALEAFVDPIWEHVIGAAANQHIEGVVSSNDDLIPEGEILEFTSQELVVASAAELSPIDLLSAYKDLASQTSIQLGLEQVAEQAKEARVKEVAQLLEEGQITDAESKAYLSKLETSFRRYEAAVEALEKRFRGEDWDLIRRFVNSEGTFSEADLNRLRETKSELDALVETAERLRRGHIAARNTPIRMPGIEL